MIEVEREDGVATITLRRPQTRNALTPAAFRELAARFDEVAARLDDRVLVLTGAGDAFCAGPDLSGLPENAARLAEDPLGRAEWARTTTAAVLALTDHRR